MAFQYDTKNQSFRQIMGNGLKYEVPRFQRDYSWKQEQWYDLWQDVVEIKDSRDKHYMGYLVLESSDNKNFVIIDGQQRLTTISILILSILDYLQELIDQNKESKENEQRKETLFRNFIGFTDPVSLSFENKITLNRNNSLYFRNYLCQLKPPPQRKIKASEKLMGQAFSYFKKEFKQLESSWSGKDIARFIEEDIVDKLFFTTITVGSDVNAYTIFETLNARGVQLSTPDLVKNHIFSLIDSDKNLHEEQLGQLEERWAEITKQLGEHEFSHFIRVDWNTRNPFTRKTDLFKNIKRELNSKEKANAYLDYLQQNSEIYSSLKNEKDEFWKSCKDGKYNNQKQLFFSLRTLNLFNITIPQSALIVAFHKFDVKDFVKFASYVETLSIRYNIIGNKLPGPLEKVYNEITQSINSSNYSLARLRSILKEVYPDDEAFIHSFRDKIFKTQRTERKVRYLLQRIESYFNPEGNVFDESNLTLEHILPKNPSAEWSKNIDEMENCIHCIGNMTLLSRNDNKGIGSLPFLKKQEVYKKSSIKITKQIASYESWKKADILNRQKWLAEQARNLWKIQF